MPAILLRTGALACVAVWTLAGCSPSNRVPVTVDGLRPVVGTDLIGARGATAVDQGKIDSTAAGLCGAKVWTASECARHGRDSRTQN